MAVSTGDGGVFPVQREGHSVRPAFEPVHAIVAGHTFGPILGHMLLYKHLVVIAVALDTTGGGGFSRVAGMAAVAGGCGGTGFGSN